MTVSEVKTRFLIELDAVASGAAPGFTDSEISELVDKAQKDLVAQLAMAKKWDDLYTLVDKTTGSLVSGVYGSRSYMATLPANFGYPILVRAKASRQDLGMSADDWFNCDEVSYSILNKFLTTPFNQPFFKNPVVCYWNEDGSTEYVNVIVDYRTVAGTSNAFELTYVKYPSTFSITRVVNLEIPETLHDLVVAMAVEEAVKSLKTAKISTQ